MKRRIAAMVFAGALFVSVPPVLAAVYRHVYSQLAGHESAMMIGSVSMVYTAVIYLPVLLVAVLFWALSRPRRRHRAPPPRYDREVHAYDTTPSGVPSSGRRGRRGTDDAARFHLFWDHPVLYLIFCAMDRLTDGPRSRDR